MTVVASKGEDTTKSEGAMESSALHILSGATILDFMNGMIGCGPTAHDGKPDKSRSFPRRVKRHSSKSKPKLSPKKREEVSKVNEYIHVDDMTDDEIAESWYTNDDIKKFRKQQKDELRLRKQRIQMERMQSEGILDISDGEQIYNSESDSESFRKAVSWGGSVTSDSESEGEVSDQEQTSSQAPKPVLKTTQSSDNALLVDVDGMAYRREKTAQRTTMEQRRLTAMHKAFYRSGILFRGDQNRMERFFHLSSQFEELKEEEKTSEHEENDYSTLVSQGSLMDYTNEESKAEAEVVKPEDYEQTTSVIYEEEKVELEAPEPGDKDRVTLAARQVLMNAMEAESKSKAEPVEVDRESVITRESHESSHQKRKSRTDTSTDKRSIGPEMLFSYEAFPDELSSQPSATKSALTDESNYVQRSAKSSVKSPSIVNMDLVLSKRTQQSRHSHHENPFDSKSFSFPSYPAAYDDPSNHYDYYEHRMNEVSKQPERSSALPDLHKKFQAFRKKLAGVTKSVKAYQKAIAQMEQARSACFDECADLIPVPINKIRPGTFQLAMEKSPMTKLKEFCEMEQAQRGKDFQKSVLDYVTQWEADVSQRINKEMKQVKKLQQCRSHYEKKVETIRKKVSSLEAKGKEISADMLDKLQRNEVKLRDAVYYHELNASRLCAIIEQVTQYGWKDLLPLVSNLLKYEFNRSGGELAIYGKFPIVLDSFQQHFRQFDTESKITDLD